MKQFLRTTSLQQPYLKPDADPKWRQFYRWRYEAIATYTPNPGDALVNWFGRPVYCYYDICAIYAGAPTASGGSVQPPFETTQGQWALRDDAGNPLYIPYNCAGGKCPQLAGDVTSPEFVAYQIGQIKTIIAKGYRGLWLDDVNLDPRVSDGNGMQVLPVGITTEAWAARMVEYVEQIRAAFPEIKIIHNSLWQSTAPQALIARQIRAADYINIERGFGDPNLTLDTTLQLCEYIHQVHAWDRSVIIEELSQASLSQSLQWCARVCKENDMLAVLDLTPENWPAALA